MAKKKQSFDGAKLRELRLQQKINQYEFAENINVHQYNVSQWEREERQPRFEHILTMAKYFNCPVENLTKTNK